MPVYSAYCYLTSNSQQYSPLDPLELKQNFLRLKLGTKHWEGLPNSFYLPRGSKPGIGWILLTGEEAKALDTSKSDHSLTFVGPNTVTLSNLIITDIRSLTAETWEITDNIAVMIQLQDIRYKCRMISINKGYNLTTPNNDGTKLYTTGSHAKYYRTTDPFTWTSMIQDIADDLPISISLSNAALPSSLPENYHFRGVSAMDALQRIASDIGHHLTLNREGTTLSFITGDFEATQPDFKPWLADFNGGEQVGTLTKSRPHPEKIVVYFPKSDYAFQMGSTGEPHWNDLFLNEPLHEEELDTSALDSFPTGAPVLSGTREYLHANLLARFDEDGNFINQSEVENTARDLAEAFFTYKANDDDSGIIRGAWAVNLDAVNHKVGWYDTGKGLHTKIGNDRDDKDLASFPPEKYATGGLLSVKDLIQPTIPHNETTHRWGIAVLSGDLEKDESVQATVQFGSWNTSGDNDHVDWTSSNNTIRVYNSFPVSYNSGDRVYVVYHRQVERWLCLAPVKGDPGSLIRFKMKSHLPLGGKGIAKEIGTSPGFTEIGSNFPIKDPWKDPGSWRDDTTIGQNQGSYMGWCLIPDNPEIADGQFKEGEYEGQPFREIVWMEQIATFINFTATGETTKDDEEEDDPWTVSATVDDWYQGKDPGDAFDEQSLNLYDPQHLWPYIMENSKGKARYNIKEHRYEIVVVNQMAFACTAELSADMCSDDSHGAITGVEPASFSIFGMKPTIGSAENTHKMCGQAGDKVTLLYIHGDAPEPEGVDSGPEEFSMSIADIESWDCGSTSEANNYGNPITLEKVAPFTWRHDYSGDNHVGEFSNNKVAYVAEGNSFAQCEVTTEAHWEMRMEPDGTIIIEYYIYGEEFWFTQWEKYTWTLAGSGSRVFDQDDTSIPPTTRESGQEGAGFEGITHYALNHANSTLLLSAIHTMEAAANPGSHWRIIAVDHKEIEAIIDHKIVLIPGSPDCCQHQVKKLKLCVMTCEDPEEAEWQIVPGPDECCQEEPPEGCCGCEPFPQSGTTVLEAEMTGAQEGTADIPQSTELPEGVCAKFEGRIDFSSSPCLGITGVDIAVTCYEATGILEVSPLEVGGGICNAVLESVFVNECDPFRATITYRLEESIFGGCDPCNPNDLIVLTLTEKEPT